ncbi:MAG: glycosyltransferase family 39 protein [Anaerolineales bacterium]
MTFVILLLALFPPILVVLDRWLDVQWIRTQFLPAWCYPTEYCNAVLPAYFVIILPGVLLLLLLFVLRSDDIRTYLSVRDPFLGRTDQRPSLRHRRAGNFLIMISIVWLGWRILNVWTRISLPGREYLCAYLLLLCGWLLREVPLARIAAGWKERRSRFGFLLINHLSLLGVLASVFTSDKYWPIFLLVFALSLIAYRNALRRVPVSYWIFTLALIVFTPGINHWGISIVGDEYAFFRYAQNIVQAQSISNIGDHLFFGQGVYQTHPYFSSLIQAAFMKIFGVNNFGWRFSNIYLSAVAIGLLHSVFRGFLRERVADFAALFLAFSQYLISFGKIGYNNLQAFFLLAVVLYFARKTIAHRRAYDFALLGAACGLCFYVYPAALFVPPLALFLLLLYDPPVTRGAIRNWAIFSFCLLVLLLPLFSQQVYWLNKIPGTFLNTPELSRSPSSIAYHLSSNLLSATFSFLYAPQETHFVAASYIDPLSAALALIGFSLLLSKFRTQKFAAFFVTGFAFLLFFLGATHDRSVPSTTRMFLLLPWFAVSSAIGMTWIIRRSRCLPSQRTVTSVVAGMIMVGCLGLNLYQAFPLAEKRMSDRYHSFQVLFLRDAARLLTPGNDVDPQITILNRPDTHLLESLYELLDIYRIPYHREQLEEVDAVTVLEDETKYDEWLHDAHSLIIITPWVYGETRTSIERVLIRAGKQPEEVKNSIGDTVYVVWENPAD